MNYGELERTRVAVSVDDLGIDDDRRTATHSAHCPVAGRKRDASVGAGQHHLSGEYVGDFYGAQHGQTTVRQREILPPNSDRHHAYRFMVAVTYRLFHALRAPLLPARCGGA